jgi:anaerobic magnesium-protoporphyrin IX monomethyl ester cyclase
MNLAIVQPVADARAAQRPFRQDVAATAAALRAHGHNVALLILDTCDESALGAMASDVRPELILIYVESLAADLAFRIAGVLAQIHRAPLVAFGPHASLMPDECLSMRGAEAVVVGPADLVAPDYVSSRASSLDHLRTPGFWVKCETGVMRNPPPRPPESSAALPAAARDLYLSDRLVDTAGFAEIEVARGGEGSQSPPAAGSPAAPPPQAVWPPTAAWPVLHRPADAVFAEMHEMVALLLDLGGLRIGNVRWTSSAAWLAAFAQRYPKKIGLPIRTTLHAADVTAPTAELLAQALCEEVRIPIGSGSALIRSDVLGLAVSAEGAAAAFAALRAAAVPSVAVIEIGAPYETPASLEQTVEFLRRIGPDRIEASLHYPEPGTPAHKIAKENGWLVPDPVAAHLAGRPAVALPRLSADDLVTACEELPFAVLRPRIAPLIRLARRVRIGNRGTLHELVLKPFLAPARRRP